MGIHLTTLQPSLTQFHGAIPGKKAEPLGQINLEVIFGQEHNSRSELLCFEVVPFYGGYHVVLGG